MCALKHSRVRPGWFSLALVLLGTANVVASCSRGNSPAAPTPPGLDKAAVVGHAGSLSHTPLGVSPAAPADVNSMLAAVRRATARYHDISKALDDGYQLGYRGVVTGCIANPGVGAMGYHYFNWSKMDDPSIVDSDPEVLVYHTAEDGTLVLGAVEWVVPRLLWEDAGNSDPPSVFGQTLHVLNPVLNWYIEHAWLWKDNPDGMFADWNPDVSCP